IPFFLSFLMEFYFEGAPLLLVLLVVFGLQSEATHVAQVNNLTHHQNITLAVILPQNNTKYPWAWPRIGPAVIRAIRNINADPTLLPNCHLMYFFKNSENNDGMCSESVAPLMAVDLKLAHDPWAFIGPGCSYSSAPVGRFTTHWDIPMVTAGAPAVAFSDGTYPFLTNTGPTHKNLGRFAFRICEHFGWRERVMLVFSDNKVDDRPCYFTIEGLKCFSWIFYVFVSSMNRFNPLMAVIPSSFQKLYSPPSHIHVSFIVFSLFSVLGFHHCCTHILILGSPDQSEAY
uniref:Receptor ligand binding region domain-containing protein n=1 Tax=Amphilophus citrinellus TaxID=61819 RepID=A0A3Q0RJG4_AMPCI